MSLHINRFIDRVRSAEHRRQREFVMTLVEARELQADLLKLLLMLNTMGESRTESEIKDTVEINGGGF